MRKLFPLILASLLLTLTASAQMASGTDSKTTSPTTEKRAAFRATKDQIIEVQNKLKQANLYTGEATGKMDDATKTAIKGFQKDNGLKASGSLNRATLEKMGIELTDKQKLIPVSSNSYATPKEPKPIKAAKSNSGSTASTGDGPKRPAPFRANADQISAAQKILRDGNLLAGGNDGKLDDATRDGLGKYQEANGLKVTKTLNAATLEKMGIALTDGQKSQVAAQASYDAAKATKN